MSTYAIGDIHGCLDELLALLTCIDFTPGRDRLWLVGDLVNGGPDSLGVLRWAREHDAHIDVVLGNHDLHLLAVWAHPRLKRPKDNCDPILEAPDAPELMDWLRHRPLLHVEGEHVLVHAGLLPQWSVPDARAVASDIEQALRAPDYAQLLLEMYGNEPRKWREDLALADRRRLGINAMTRMRLLDPQGALEFKFKGELADRPPGYQPWFEAPQARWTTHTAVTGHWSALGLALRPHLIALDTGCVWGRTLSAICLEDRHVTQVERTASGQLCAVGSE